MYSPAFRFRFVSMDQGQDLVLPILVPYCVIKCLKVPVPLPVQIKVCSFYGDCTVYKYNVIDALF